VESKQSEFDRKSPIHKVTDDENAHDEPEAKKSKVIQTNNNNDNESEFDTAADVTYPEPEISTEEHKKEEANQNKTPNSSKRRKSVKSTPAEPDSEKVCLNLTPPRLNHYFFFHF
jgi:hypothetical protein